MEEIPQWAYKAALKQAVAAGMPNDSVSPNGPYTGPLLAAFARYIASKEEPPADPLEEAVSDLLPSAGEHPLEVVIRTALKRGMELAKSETSNA